MLISIFIVQNYSFLIFWPKKVEVNNAKNVFLLGLIARII